MDENQRAGRRAEKADDITDILRKRRKRYEIRNQTMGGRLAAAL